MIKHNDITIGIGGAELDSLKQELFNELQDKRITWQGEDDVLVTTVLQRIYEFAAGKVQILLADTLPSDTEPNTQYWVKNYSGSTLEDGRFIIMTDYLNHSTYIGTSSVDLTEYVKTEELSGYVTTDRVATTAQTGMVKIGSGISVDENGTISVSGGSVSTATTGTTGVVKVGDGLSVTQDGTLSTKVQSQNVGNNVVNLWIGTQAEYDALSGSGYSNYTIYVIKPSSNQ